MPIPRPVRKLTHRQAADCVSAANAFSSASGDGLVAGGANPAANVNGLQGRIATPLVDMLCKVTASEAVDGGTYQWTYTVKPVLSKATAGYGTADWVTVDDGVTAYNLAEIINDDATGSGPYGNGVHVDDLAAEGDYDLVAIPTNTIVTVRAVPVAAGPAIEYWIISMGVPNGVTGDCG